MEKKVVSSQLFGKLDDGRKVFLYTLTNKNGLEVSISAFGAALTSLMVPDRNGKMEDVVFGYDSLADYQNDTFYFGALIGRYGNRIAKGKFTLSGKEYHVTVNDGENHLHGGRVGFNKVLWDAKEVLGTAAQSVELTYLSKDGEEGFPGNLSVKVTYTLTDQNELRIDYKGTTDKTTVCNLTHHSYFNLSGSFLNTILQHLLTITADAITPVDKGLIPTGEMLDVTKTPFDFRTATAVGARINEANEQLILGRGYDHNWVLSHYDGKVHKAAELYEPQSGRLMVVSTDQPGLQFYTSNYLDGSVKGKGAAYKYRTGLCLEAQRFPDSPNRPEFPSVTLQPGETYRQTTLYQFSAK
jgi:aldose 1-epimerase